MIIEIVLIYNFDYLNGLHFLFLSDNTFFILSFALLRLHNLFDFRSSPMIVITISFVLNGGINLNFII